MEIIRDNRSHKRESLNQVVAYLEKYQIKKDPINAYAVEEAVRHKYQVAMSISEIYFFLDKDGCGGMINQYAQHYKEVQIEDGAVVLKDNLSSKVLLIGRLNISRYELRGYFLYILLATVAITLSYFASIGATGGMVEILNNGWNIFNRVCIFFLGIYFMVKIENRKVVCC